MRLYLTFGPLMIFDLDSTTRIRLGITSAESRRSFSESQSAVAGLGLYRAREAL
jgi:hypothetical protein